MAILILSLSAGAFLFSVVSVAVIRRWVTQRGLLDTPNARSSHIVPTPTAGGIAIAAAVLLGLGVMAYFTDAWRSQLSAVGLCGLTIAAVSLVDDVRGLGAKARFAVHLAAAGGIVAAVGSWEAIAVPGLPVVDLGWFAIPATVIWIVGLTNAFNFMDGIDGLAAGQGVVAGASWAIIGWIGEITFVMGTGALLAGASLGFLVHNKPPARIFMGDVGSAFLGFMFAVIAVGAAGEPRLAVAGILAVWPFVFDSLFTFLYRLRLGHNLLEAHRLHLYQRLTVAGYGHGRVSLLYCGLATLGGSAAVAVALDANGAGWMVSAVAMLAAGMWGFVRHAERKVRGHSPISQAVR